MRAGSGEMRAESSRRAAEGSSYAPLIASQRSGYSPLVAEERRHAVLTWYRGAPVTGELFLGHVRALSRRLTGASWIVNACDDRYLFTVAFAAACLRGRCNLLPASRAPQYLRELFEAHAGAQCVRDDDVEAVLDVGDAGTGFAPDIANEHIAAVAFTSGSTGLPAPHAKRWGDLVLGARLARRRFAIGEAGPMAMVGTVPPQHMYGLETSVLLPLMSTLAVHAGRPFFPEDVRIALTEVPPPRLLITTPVHLRACMAARLRWPEVALVISATAPLPVTLAAEAEAAFGGVVKEIYGFTEAGSIASRRTLDGEVWQLYDGLSLGGDHVEGGHLPAPVRLNDIVEPAGRDRFRLLGRLEDVVNVAGRRTSLAYLNHQLLAIEGVEDGAFIASDEVAGTPRRLAALVVAPELGERALLTALARRVDPVFLPRPLYRVDRLPRNATGKLARGELLAALRRLAAERNRG